MIHSKYRQSINLLYNPMLVSVPMCNYDVYINYVDMLDETAVEFPHQHGHDYEIYYSLEGSLNILADQTIHKMEAGDFLLLSPTVVHGAIYEPQIPRKYLVIVFSFEENKKSDESEINTFEKEHIKTILNQMPAGRYIVQKDCCSADRYVDAMIQEVTSKGFGWQFLLRSHYMNFIMTVLRNVIEQPNIQSAGNRINLPIAITKFMHENYSHDIELQNVADELHISPRHVTRIFKEYFGSSFSKTLTLYRLSYAKNYLCDTDYSVEKISEYVGFSSTSTLFRLFKDFEGITIAEYRSRHKSKLQ